MSYSIEKYVCSYREGSHYKLTTNGNNGIIFYKSITNEHTTITLPVKSKMDINDDEKFTDHEFCQEINDLLEEFRNFMKKNPF